MVMSRNASTTTTLELLRPMVPPVYRPPFSERDFMSRIGMPTRCASDMGMVWIRHASYCPVPWPCWPDLPTSGGSTLAHLLRLQRARFAIC